MRAYPCQKKSKTQKKMSYFLQDPRVYVLGGKKFLRLCCFGKNAKKITAWMQKMAWEEHPEYNAMLYSLHIAFHSKKPLDNDQLQFINIDCKVHQHLQPLFTLLSSSSHQS